MMLNFYMLLFNETVHENYPGFSSRGDIPLTPYLCREKSDMFSLLAMLNNRRDTHTLILRRAGNTVCVDWEKMSRIIRRIRGITKVQVGSVPSDVYIIERERFVQLIRQMLKSNTACDFTGELFNRLLFHNFERIIRISGHSLKLRDYFLDNGFLEIYSGLNNTHARGATIAEGGTVKNSMIGSGSRIEGYVENSVIFHDVHIASGTAVRGSVILPFNTVDDGTQVTNTIILEGNGRIIGRESSIGGFSDAVNSTFSDVLKKGLTVMPA